MDQDQRRAGPFPIEIMDRRPIGIDGTGGGGHRPSVVGHANEGVKHTLGLRATDSADWYASSILGQEREIMGATALANRDRERRLALLARRARALARLWQDIAFPAAFLAPLAVAFVVYWPRLGDYFVYDDFLWLRAVHNHSFWVVMYRAFTFPVAKPFDEVTRFWRPLTDLYFYGARSFGLHPEPYHVVNVLVHGLVGSLAVVFLRRLTGSLVAATAAALLFTVAPTYEFAVTWVSQVSEFFGAALILCALLAYHAYLTADEPRRIYPAATVSFTVLALLAKESTIILLLLLPALVLALPRGERRRSLKEVTTSLAPVAGVGLAFAVVMLVHEYRTEGDAYEIGPHMFRNLRDYLKWMVFPHRFGDGSEWRTLGALTFLASGALAFALRQRLLALLFVWTIAALLPFCGFSFGIELRYTYLATLPFTAFVVFGARAAAISLPPPLRVPAQAVLTVAAIVALIVTPIRTRDFQTFVRNEARGYEVMVESVRELCGPLPRESTVFVLRAPYRDLGGVHTPAALNLYYDRVHAASVDELPDLIAFVPNKCVIEYDPQTGGYRRVDVE